MDDFRYYEEHKTQIDRIIAEQDAESFGCLVGLVLVIAVYVLAYVICAGIAPVTLFLLLKAVNTADNESGRSLRDMFRAHPVIRVLSYADMALFGMNVLGIVVVAMLSRYGQLPLSAYENSSLYQFILWFGSYPRYGLLAAGTVLLVIAAVNSLIPSRKR